VDIPFDPFELTAYPSYCQGLHRANAFIGGILFNRIVFLAAQGSEIGTEKPDGYLSNLNEKITEIEKHLDFFKPMLDRSKPGFDFIFDRILDLKALRLKKALPFAKPGEMVLLPRSDQILESQRAARKSNFDTGQKNAAVFKEFFFAFKDFFDLGLIIDGATHGYEGQVWSGIRFLEIKKKKKVKGFCWNLPDGRPLLAANNNLFSGSKHLLRHIRISVGQDIFPFDALESQFELPPPEQWGAAIVDVWNKLATIDRLECGFERVRMDNGKIYLDGTLVGQLAPRGQPYLALRFMVEELKKTKDRFFTSFEIYSEVYKRVPKQSKKKKGAGRVTSQQMVQGNRTTSRNGKTIYLEYGNIYRRMDKKIQEMFPRIRPTTPQNGFSIEIQANPQAFLV
jgi:hypothetical protein